MLQFGRLRHLILKLISILGVAYVCSRKRCKLKEVVQESDGEISKGRSEGRSRKSVPRQRNSDHLGHGPSGDTNDPTMAVFRHPSTLTREPFHAAAGCAVIEHAVTRGHLSAVALCPRNVPTSSYVRMATWNYVTNTTEQISKNTSTLSTFNNALLELLDATMDMEWNEG